MIQNKFVEEMVEVENMHKEYEKAIKDLEVENKEILLRYGRVIFHLDTF